MKKWIAGAMLLSVAASSLIGCNDSNGNFQIKQEHNMDRRGMLNNRNVEQDRVNTNLPQGGTQQDKMYRDSTNIRPGDANGGIPPTTEEPGAQRGSMKPSTVNPAR